MSLSISGLTRRLALAALACVAFGAQATERSWTYEITVTNITYNQRFTPLLLATHNPAVAYDAGSEINDELCSSIPGPNFAECGGSGGGAKVNGGEGFVHVHRGMHGVGDFKAIARDWRNPVATVSVRLLR